jgi:hypothetical protein
MDTKAFVLHCLPDTQLPCGQVTTSDAEAAGNADGERGHVVACVQMHFPIDPARLRSLASEKPPSAIGRQQRIFTSWCSPSRRTVHLKTALTMYSVSRHETTSPLPGGASSFIESRYTKVGVRRRVELLRSTSQADLLPKLPHQKSGTRELNSPALAPQASGPPRALSQEIYSLAEGGGIDPQTLASPLRLATEAST